MKPLKFIPMLLATTGMFAASFQGLAQPTSPSEQLAEQQLQDIYVGGYSFAFDFNTFVYYLFLVRTDDVSEPTDVNDISIVTNYEDDPNAFYRVLWLP